MPVMRHSVRFTFDDRRSVTVALRESLQNLAEVIVDPGVAVCGWFEQKKTVEHVTGDSRSRSVLACT